MRKTSKELAEFYGIKVGDVVKIKSDFGNFKINTYEVVLWCGEIKLKCEAGFNFDVSDIEYCEYEVIKPKKKYGDLKCKNFHSCNECPLRSIACTHVAGNTLYGILEESWLKHGYTDGTDNPIYKAYKAELDKEVE